MKYLLTGVAMAAALAISAPVLAQGVSPSGGNAVGAPGPNPGGPGLTPYSGGAPQTMAPAAMAPSSETTSAMPPKHRASRHAAHKAAGHHGKGTQLSGDTANQLNQEELQRLQAGNFSNPPAPPGPDMAPPGPGTSTTGRMPAGGRPTSSRYQH
jgi:hypothetical protein